MKTGEQLEQGIPSLSWGWITSFLGDYTPRLFVDSRKYNSAHQGEHKQTSKCVFARFPVTFRKTNTLTLKNREIPK